MTGITGGRTRDNISALVEAVKHAVVENKVEDDRIGDCGVGIEIGRDGHTAVCGECVEEMAVLGSDGVLVTGAGITVRVQVVAGPYQHVWLGSTSLLAFTRMLRRLSEFCLSLTGM